MLGEECWVIEVCGLASGWFRREQERDSGGQAHREVKIIWSNQDQDAHVSLRTAETEERKITTRSGLKGPGHRWRR